MKGAAYIAPAGFHMVIESQKEGKYCVRLDETALVNYIRPAADVTFASVADVFDGEVITVVLTGMGRDGATGAKVLKEKRGAKVIVQDEDTSVVYGMPKAVVEEGVVDDIIPLRKIAQRITEYITHG